MNKQVVSFVQLTELYNILNEIKNILPFDIRNYSNKEEFFLDLNKNNNLNQTTIITNSKENFNSNISKYPDGKFKELINIIMKKLINSE